MNPQPNEHERYFEDERAASDAGWPRWVDTHSVTCPICGGFADERETVNLWPDEHPDPVIRDEIERVVDEYGHGEAHQGCYDDVVEVMLA